jgi:hypothetical protein
LGQTICEFNFAFASLWIRYGPTILQKWIHWFEWSYEINVLIALRKSKIIKTIVRIQCMEIINITMYTYTSSLFIFIAF